MKIGIFNAEIDILRSSQKNSRACKKGLKIVSRRVVLKILTQR